MGKKIQVDPFQAKESNEKALKIAGNPLSRVVIFKDADHGIARSETGCLKEQRERQGAVNAPGYIDLMQSWLKSLMDLENHRLLSSRFLDY